MKAFARSRVGVLILAASLAVGASAKQPTGFVTFTVNKASPTTAGTWTVTGAIVDQGTCCIDAPHFLRGVSGAVRVIDELNGTNGSLTWKVDAMYNGRALGSRVVALEGAWQIVGGDGIYAGAEGQGQVSGTYNQATEESTW
jgi:hypothetical protein